MTLSNIYFPQNESFVYYSGYTEDELFQGHQYIIEKMAERTFHKLALYKKYANKKFLKASTFAVKWSRARVTGADGVENTMLDAGPV